MSPQPQRFPFNNLPLELQREIFLAGALDGMYNATRIVRVSKKAYSWILPIIYNMVTLGSDDTALFMRTLASKPAEFFATHVKCLCLSASVKPNDAERILSTCTGVKILAFWVDYLSAFPDSSISPLISPLSLRRLSIEAQHLYSMCQSTPKPSGGLDRSWYTHLTHLDVVFWHPSYTLPYLSNFPSLTHVGIWHPNGLVDDDVIQPVLDSCKRLEILLVVVDEGDLDLIQNPLTSQDPRVVLMPYPSTVILDWEALFTGKPSTWARAKEARIANAKMKRVSDCNPERPHRVIS
ncbi:hypothetical protein P691DRAFT_519853 [Macrolepiota fuliginosa MF-IS2]|uniref:Uncharacterized protein n=1 Tax=Macrolepiota fuliginosa MF-IS2 TaxID=1400762 RepID=A0A9P5XFM5_9AGAR|nr:hypothetical protein P691DRAFT_519853 [Macrolepiota fuliginosa MF-IS2]